MNINENGPFSRLFKFATKIETNEIKPTLLSFGFIFLLMFAYNILKPVRDALMSEWTDVELASLWTLNFVIGVIAVSVYGMAISRAKLKNIIPGVYAFFALLFVLFYVAASSRPESVLMDKAFYACVTLFSLFHVSVFWSLMADLFSRQQAPRLFAFISSGASIGTIAGSAATLILVKSVGTLNLLLVAACILLATMPMIGMLRSSVSDTVGRDHQDIRLGGNPFSGFQKLTSNPYLLGIALFIFLYTFIGSFAYFELKNLLAGNSRETNTAIWAGIGLSINSIAIGTAMFATSRIATRLGLGKTLALVPVGVAVVFLGIFGSPVLAVVIVAWVGLKAGNYSITRPGREMLYTNVSREDRFKTKQVIDIVVYRGGDLFSGWVFALLTASAGLGMGPIALIGAVVAILWAYVGLRLGNQYDRESLSNADYVQ